MKKLTIYIVLAMLCSFSTAKGQITPLKVGQRLSDNFWTQEHLIYDNGKVIKNNISEFKGKLLILDFWATWCGICIHNFPNLSKIQKHFDDKIKILLVNAETTKDTSHSITQFFTKNRDLFCQSELSTICEDKYLKTLFPHFTIPKYVWIDSKGKIVAITNSEFININQIQLIIDSQNKAI